MFRNLLGALDDAFRFVVAIAAAVLPKRYWPDLELRVPVSRAAFTSGLATFALAFAIGVPAFLSHAEANTALAIRAMLEETGWRTPAEGADRPAAGTGTTLWGTSYLGAFTFALLTPVGWLSMYLGFTGLIRMVAVYADDARGDPLLSIVDATLVRRSSRRRVRHDTQAREAREGVEVPDRLVTGHTAGLLDAELVVIASRRKAGWRKGVFVITAEKWYRLGEPVDRETPTGLRTMYPLNEIRDQEAVRNAVEYELPPLKGRR